MSGELTDKQLGFVEHYVASHNATQAAIRAGYVPRTARQQGSRLLTKADIRAAISKREACLADELGLTKQHVLERLSALLEVAMTPTPQTYRGDAVRISDDDGNTRMLTDIDGGVAIRAIELLMRHRSMLTDRHQVEHTDVVYTLDLGDGLRASENQSDDSAL
jgi:hypothetical protein